MNYLSVDWNEQNVGVQPDAEDHDLAVETGAQFVAQAWPYESHTPESRRKEVLSRGRIFSCVQSFYEPAMSDLDP